MDRTSTVEEERGFRGPGWVPGGSQEDDEGEQTLEREVSAGSYTPFIYSLAATVHFPTPSESS